MADILAAFGILIFLSLSYPGLLLTWKLLFPDLVHRAQIILERTPWRSFWLGLGAALLFGIPALILISNPAGIAKLVGWAVVALILALSSIGSAGLVGCMGARLAGKSASNSPGFRRFLLGALALELSVAFPIIGWFLLLPLSTIASLGAAVLAVLRRKPKPATDEVAQTLVESVPNGL